MVEMPGENRGKKITGSGEVEPVIQKNKIIL